MEFQGIGIHILMSAKTVLAQFVVFSLSCQCESHVQHTIREVIKVVQLNHYLKPVTKLH
jgi:hypothetical protein